MTFMPDCDLKQSTEASSHNSAFTAEIPDPNVNSSVTVNRPGESGDSLI
ncbi:Uncharacterised protein [Mycobacterium tuberculosis]|nr:Uncharacterised protein [Mycobacterium tuberculosis]